MRMPAATKKGGMAQATPDVCHVPITAPPGGVPTPFPNIANLNTCDKTVDKVLMEKKETIVEDSEVPNSKGDEAGSSSAPTPKGLVSQSNLGKCVFKAYSSKVFLKGKKAVYHTAMTAHNGGNANAPAGTHTSASQSKVEVAK
jgi:hypothetical protein